MFRARLPARRDRERRHGRSGGTGGAETHSHGLPLNINGGSVASGADVTVFPPGTYTSDPASSFPPYHEVVWVVRIK